MVSTCSTGNQRSARFRGSSAPFDKLERQRPVQSHTTLCCVHRLGYAKAKRPEMLSVGECCLPIYNWLSERIRSPQRVHHHMGRCEGDSRFKPSPLLRHNRFVGGSVLIRRSIGPPQFHGCLQSQASSSGTSIQRRSCHDLMPSSANCTPRAPSEKS